MDEDETAEMDQLDQAGQRLLELLDSRSFRILQALHLVSAVAFLIFLYIVGPGWIGVGMAFIVGVNLAQARFYQHAARINIAQRGLYNALQDLRDHIRQDDGVSETTGPQ